VSFFLALLDNEAGNADQLCVAERAEHCGTAEPIENAVSGRALSTSKVLPNASGLAWRASSRMSR
jgi:hypothetical protein